MQHWSIEYLKFIMRGFQKVRNATSDKHSVDQSNHKTAASVPSGKTCIRHVNSHTSTHIIIW